MFFSPRSVCSFGCLAAETVIFRIFYHCNKAGNGQLQLREIKRSNLVAALQQVDVEEDINKVLK